MTAQIDEPFLKKMTFSWYLMGLGANRGVGKLCQGYLNEGIMVAKEGGL
jgi:hypothetical protein